MKQTNYNFFFLIIIALFFFQTTDISAQQYKKSIRTFSSGDVDLSVGTGLPLAMIKSKAQKINFPYYLSLDYRFSKLFSIGLVNAKSSILSQKREHVEGMLSQWFQTQNEFGIKIGTHFSPTDIVDIYGGINSSYLVIKMEDQLPNMEEINRIKRIQPKQAKVVYGGFIGVRVALNKNLSAFSEIGSGLVLLRIGAGYKLF